VIVGCSRSTAERIILALWQPYCPPIFVCMKVGEQTRLKEILRFCPGGRKLGGSRRGELPCRTLSTNVVIWLWTEYGQHGERAAQFRPLYGSPAIRPLVPVNTTALLGSNSLILPL
jgi:hypothetical protein